MDQDDPRRPNPRSQCELFGGPLDGASYDIPETQQLLRFNDQDDQFTFNVYEREGESSRFLYRGQERHGQ